MHGKLFGMAAALLLTGATAAHAQSIDYGGLEELFGEPVTTSVTGSPQRASEVPASMTIITQDEIRRSGARDITGVLRHVAGVDVMQWTNDQADVAVRGYNQAFSSRLLVLVNGREVYADFYTFTPWSTLPIELSDIRQIEIVKGPNSALFGFNAGGAVINIITYDPLHDGINNASVMGGTQSLVQGSGVATFKLGDSAGLRISLGGRGNEDFSTRQRAADIGSRQGDSRRAIDVLAHARLARGIDASIELSHSEIYEPEIISLYSAYYLNFRVTSVQARVAADTGLGLIEANAYGNWYRGAAPSLNPAWPVYRINSPTYVFQVQDVFKVGSAHTFRLSAEYRRADMETTPLAGAHAFYDVVGFGGMWNWVIDPGLSLTNAVRLDHLSFGRTGLTPPGYGLTNNDWNRRSLDEISFNTGLVWQPGPDDTLRATIGRGVQLPNLLSMGGLFLSIPPFGFASGTPFVDPAIVTNYELGWDHKLPDWNAKFTARAYYEMTRNISANSAGSIPSANIIFAPVNIGRSSAVGLELALSGTFEDGWRWGLSYTPEVINDNFLPAYKAVTFTFVNYEKTHPVHVVKANLGWANDRWEIDGYLRYKSRFESIQGNGQFLVQTKLVPISDYVSVDARIAYRITDKLTLAVSGQDLLQSPQKQTSAAAVERRVYAAISIDF